MAVAWELLIVTLGVLIALAAQQVVEDSDWRRKVLIVRQSLFGELANDRGRWEFNISNIPCTLREIELLDGWASRAVAGAAAPQTPWLNNVPVFWMHSANWRLATSSQTLDHFPLKEQLDLAALYDGVEHRQIDLEKVTDLYERTLGLIPLAADLQTRLALRATLGDLKMKSASLVANDGYMKRHFDAVGVRADHRDFAEDVTGPRCPG